jgi:hypothetical protein
MRSASSTRIGFRIMKKTIHILFSLIIFIGNTYAQIIDFNELPEGIGNNTYSIGDYYQFEDYQIKGTLPYSSRSSSFHVYETNSLNWTGSVGLTYFGVSGLIELSTISGSLFNIDSIDISRGDQNSGLIGVGFIGNKVDGTQVIQAYNFTDSLIGKSVKFKFSPKFNNLKSLVWYQGAEWHQFDNISVNPVTEPQTIFIFLLSIFFVIRKTYTKILNIDNDDKL